MSQKQYSIGDLVLIRRESAGRVVTKGIITKIHSNGKYTVEGNTVILNSGNNPPTIRGLCRTYAHAELELLGYGVPDVEPVSDVEPVKHLAKTRRKRAIPTMPPVIVGATTGIE
jgi:hypothetical protein